MSYIEIRNVWQQYGSNVVLERLNLRHLLDMPVTFWDVRAADHLRH